MRVVAAKGQYFEYRVFFDSGFCWGDAEIIQEMSGMAQILAESLGGEAYCAKEAKALGQLWCYDTTKIMGNKVHYFGLVRAEDAVLLKLKHE